MQLRRSLRVFRGVMGKRLSLIIVLLFVGGTVAFLSHSYNQSQIAYRHMKNAKQGQTAKEVRLDQKPEAFRADAEGKKGRHTIDDRMGQYGDEAIARLKPAFESYQVSFPPERIVLVGIKSEKILHLYAGTPENTKFIKTYPIKAASGVTGPKLKEGDRQVPEGLYNIESLNPNSLYHLSLRIGYPNAFDRAMAQSDGRTNLGGDIMIHGKASSVGCLAMGDEAAEELFVMATLTGTNNIEVILSPIDFRITSTLPSQPKAPWAEKTLYPEIKAKLSELPLPAPPLFGK